MTNELAEVMNGGMPKLANGELYRVTSEIFRAAQSMREARKFLAAKLAEIESNVLAFTNGDDVVEWCAEFDGETPMKRFEAYGAQVLGLKRAQLRNYARIGRVCLDESGNSLLIKSGKDFSLTQLVHISTLPVDRAQELVANGELEPSMTVEEVKSVVLDSKPEAKAAKAKRAKAKEERERKQQIENGKIVAAIEVKIVGGQWFVFINGVDESNTRIGKYLVKQYKSMGV